VNNTIIITKYYDNITVICDRTHARRDIINLINIQYIETVRNISIHIKCPLIDNSLLLLAVSVHVAAPSRTKIGTVGNTRQLTFSHHVLAWCEEGLNETTRANDAQLHERGEGAPFMLS